ncbi:serpin B12-like [Dermacentor variabilis]|uniref:serpin B12-like n=1 Tax=Dermacentor variabilis TaxID=34621 RepID=UPI003F5B552A
MSNLPSSSRQADLTIRVVNRAYSAASLKVHRNYLPLRERSFRATVKSLNFMKNSEAGREEANAWVWQQTKFKVKDLLSPNTVTPETLLTLLSAVYFQAKWNYPFGRRDNRRVKFCVKGVKVGKGNMIDQMGPSEELDSQILEMPYHGNTFFQDYSSSV